MLRFLLYVTQALFDFAIVDAEELIRSGCHINIIRLSLGSLFDKETVYRVVFWGILQQGCHDLKQCLTQSCRANFGCPVALGFVLAGFIDTGINTGKGSQRFSVGKSGQAASRSST